MKQSTLYTPRDIFAHAREESEIGSLLNTDMYKFMMLDFIIAYPEYKDLTVQREMKIRSQDVKTKNVIPMEALKEQLEACRQMRGLSPVDISYLRGMTNEKNNNQPLFREETLTFLKDLQLPPFTIGDDGDGNYTLHFIGSRASSTLWEIIGLKIVNSLYLYYYTKKVKLTHSEFSEIISRSLVRLFDDIKTFQEAPQLTFSEFGTRRAMSTDYHRLVYEILHERLPQQCVGTSNVMLSREMGANNPKGTNAHELRMIPTALHDDPQKIIDTMYDVDRQWMKHHPGLGILLPDTYGTTYYLNNCPTDIIDGHTGMRFDSKDPMIGIPEYISFLQKHAKDPKKYMGIPSDGLKARTSVEIFNAFSDQMPLTFGNGTHLTNNTKGTRPRKLEEFGPFGSFSVVVKPMKVLRDTGERVSCVKLSDNPSKAMGDQERVALFMDIFGKSGMQKQDVIV